MTIFRSFGDDDGGGVQPPRGDGLEALGPLLFSIAYGMTGLVDVAEDAAQEALLRLHRAVSEGVEIVSPKAYACTVVTRLTIDRARSARVQREQYVGDWLPEPIVTGELDPAEEAELDESLSYALLVVLECLSPVERAVFLLADVFGFEFSEIASLVGKNAANCRQLAVRARRRVAERRPSKGADRPGAQRELVDRFMRAAASGEVEQLVDYLTADVALRGDGGGRSRALARPVHGRVEVARQVVGFARLLQSAGVVIQSAVVNGGPGARAVTRDGEVVGVIAIEIDGAQITALYSVVNPDKLRHNHPRRV